MNRVDRFGYNYCPFVHYKEGECPTLVLSRRLNERIHVGEDLIITVVELDRGKVRIGIEAPKHVKVYREELLTPLQVQEHLENTRANCPQAAAPTVAEQPAATAGLTSNPNG